MYFFQMALVLFILKKFPNAQQGFNFLFLVVCRIHDDSHKEKTRKENS